MARTLAAQRLKRTIAGAKSFICEREGKSLKNRRYACLRFLFDEKQSAKSMVVSFAVEVGCWIEIRGDRSPLYIPRLAPLLGHTVVNDSMCFIGRETSRR